MSNRSVFPLVSPSLTTNFPKTDETFRDLPNACLLLKMASQQGKTNRRPVFKRYSALEVLQEVLNDRESDDEDFGGNDESDSEEEEFDANQHHSLLSEIGVDDEADSDFDPEVGQSTSSRSESDMEEDEPIPGPSTATPPALRG